MTLTLFFLLNKHYGSILHIAPLREEKMFKCLFLHLSLFMNDFS